MLNITEVKPKTSVSKDSTTRHRSVEFVDSPSPSPVNETPQSLIKSLASKQSEIIMLEDQLNDAHQTNNELRGQIAKIKAEYSKFKLSSSRELEELKDYCKDNQERYDQLERSSTRKIKELEHQLNIMQRDYALLQDDHERLNLEMDVLLAKIDEMRNRNYALEKSEQHISELLLKIDMLEERLRSDQIKRDISMTAMSDSGSQSSSYQERDSAVYSLIFSDSRRVSTLATELGETDRIGKLEEENKHLISYISKIIQRILDSPDSGVKDLLQSDDHQ